MSSRMVKKKQPAPGPQSACMIRYLEGLANTVCVSQLDKPCSSVVLSSTYSNPDYKANELKVVLNTLDKYVVKK